MHYKMPYHHWAKRCPCKKLTGKQKYISFYNKFFLYSKIIFKLHLKSSIIIMSCSYIFFEVLNQPQSQWCCLCFLFVERGLIGTLPQLVQRDQLPLPFLSLVRSRFSCTIEVFASEPSRTPLRLSWHPTDHHWPEWDTRPLLHEEEI